MISCRNCGEAFPLHSFPYCCPSCGGLFGFVDGLTYDPGLLQPDLPGIWTYRSGFALPDRAPLVTLGEGNTPLVQAEFFGSQVWFKLESLNPSGSFKDRGSAVLASWLRAGNVETAVEDSSGNAGASFAAYASRAGIRSKIFIPASASGPKRAQIESYGSQVIPVPGPRSEAARAVMREVELGAVYASHAYLPQGTAGIATIAYELVEQLGEPPGAILLPVGHGSLLLGIALGFEALLKGGLIGKRPRLIGIQSAVFDPLCRAFEAGRLIPERVPEGKTIAEGVAIAAPYHGEQVLAAVRRSEGAMLRVADEQIRVGVEQLARKGIYVEITAGLVWDGLRQLEGKLAGPVVCIITSHGLKNP